MHKEKHISQLMIIHHRRSLTQKHAGIFLKLLTVFVKAPNNTKKGPYLVKKMYLCGYYTKIESYLPLLKDQTPFQERKEDLSIFFHHLRNGKPAASVQLSTGSGRKGVLANPAFPLLFHENPASRTFFH